MLIIIYENKMRLKSLSHFTELESSAGRTHDVEVKMVCSGEGRSVRVHSDVHICSGVHASHSVRDGSSSELVLCRTHFFNTISLLIIIINFLRQGFSV